MEESLAQLWRVCIWFFGISSTITVALFGWLMNIQSRISIGERIEEDLNSLKVDVKEMKNALVGDFNKEGFIAEHHNLVKRVENVEIKLLK